MIQLEKHPLRLQTDHSRFPHDRIMKDGEKNAECKYCQRTSLVDGWDFHRIKDGKDEYCCYECFDAGRASETGLDSLAHIGYIMSGLKKHEFPWAPEKGTPHQEYAGECATCGEPVWADPYKGTYIDAYFEHLRGILVHEKCGIPRRGVPSTAECEELAK
jgi:hypothetical protein